MSERLSERASEAIEHFERASLRASEAIEHFERAIQRYGAEGSLVHRSRTVENLAHSGMVHQ